MLSQLSRCTSTYCGTRMTAFGIFRLPTRSPKARSRPRKRIRASGYAAIALVSTTTATEPRDTTVLLKNARPMRAMRELLKSTSP